MPPISIEIKELKNEIKRLKEDYKLVYNDITNNLIETAILQKEKRLKKLEFINEAKSKEYMSVVYNGGMDYYDGLTTGKTYGVFDETENQFIVINDLRATSKISKDKFLIAK